MSLSLHARTTQTCSHARASDALSDGRPGSSALLKAPRPQHGAGCSCSVTFLQRLREEVGHSLCTQEKKTEVNPHPNHQPPRPLPARGKHQHPGQSPKDISTPERWPAPSHKSSPTLSQDARGSPAPSEPAPGFRCLFTREHIREKAQIWQKMQYPVWARLLN